MPSKSRAKRANLKRKFRGQKRATKRRRRASPRHMSSSVGQIHVLEGGRVMMVLPRRLKSPNAVKTHWAYRNDREGWRKELAAAVITDDYHRLPIARMIADGIKMKLDVVRLAPSTRYILDKDNCDFSAKRAVDAMKEAGWIVDDNRLWLDGPYVTQGVSRDKCYWTIISLMPMVGGGTASGHVQPNIDIYDAAKKLVAFDE